MNSADADRTPSRSDRGRWIRDDSTGDYAVAVDGLVKTFPGKHGVPALQAVAGARFSVPFGTSLGIVGESGSGKSTLARCLLGLLSSDEGSIRVLGRDVHRARRRDLNLWRRDMQMVFQSPLESLDPTMRIGPAVEEPLALHTRLGKAERRRLALQTMARVGLNDAHADRYPRQLSGGELQRVNIARAIITRPAVIVLDEPTAALDMSRRVDVLALLKGLQRDFDLTYLIVSHDLAAVGAMCDLVIVMCKGEIVETGETHKVFGSPSHPYTRELIANDLSL